jgi:hypothetical protein
MKAAKTPERNRKAALPHDHLIAKWPIQIDVSAAIA